MVMEAAIPSPLVVGREFVRQYYTLLHNSPDHLHRFYNQHSSFTHSGLEHDPSKEFDGLVIGQKNIHDKIQQMNFRDCHAKISHVDAQATLGDGVVVQVFGELSNDGHQMRRFTQTFVLACQSPKKYYVHNDIFRYHDIYNEEDEQREEHEGTESSGTTPNNTSSDGTATILVQPNVFYPAAPASVIVNSQQPPPQMVPAGFTVATVVPAVPAAQVNGVVHEEMLKNIATQTSQQVPPPQILPPAAAAAAQAPPQVLATIPMAPAPTALPIPVEPVAAPEVVSVQTSTAPVVETIQFDNNPSNEEDSDALDNSKDSDPSSEEPAPKVASPAPIIAAAVTASSAPSAPKNWANLVKAGPGIGYSPQPELPAMQTQSFVSITQQQQQQAQQQKQAENYGSVVERRQPPPPSRDRDQRERRVSSNNNDNNSCQLFLGNLPTSATEDELKQMFCVFGKIADLRIHTKQPAKPGGRPVPNYGFITFEDPQSAIKLQDAQPIFYPVLNDKSGQKINIEHKIRKNVDGGSGGMNRSQTNGSGGQNMDRGRNNNPGAGMNRNGSGGRSDRRGRDDRGGDGGNRQFNRSDRMGQNRTTNGNAAGTTYTNSRR